MTRFNFNDFCLDTQLYELQRAGQTVAMEPQVFDVLLQLVVNHERVMTKDQLMEKVWGDKYISEAALSSRIMAARKAIGDTGREQRLIRTIHGRGYRFVAPVSVIEGVAGTTMRAGRPAASDSVLNGTDNGTDNEAPLMLGRDDDLAFLTAALRRALDGKRQVVFIVGEAGLGKTTLVNAFLDQVNQTEIAVARGQCIENRGEGEPYMPLLDSLSRLCRRPEGQPLLEGLERLAPTWLAQIPGLVEEGTWLALQQRIVGSNRNRMLREIVECLDSSTDAKSIVFVLEDAHWSDQSTLDVINLLARRTEPARLLIVVTLRPAELTAENLRLDALASELTLRGLAERLDLEALPADVASAFAESRLGAPVLPTVADALAERTGGNPLYMEMVLDALRSAGTEQVDQLPESIPETLRDYIEQRLSLLTEEDRQVLEAASVVGSEFTAAAISPALNLDEEGVEERCHQLVVRGRFIRPNGTVEWSDGSVSESYAFDHDLYQEVLYQGIMAARLARMHREVGEGLEVAYGDSSREHAAELAVHFVRGHVNAKSVTYLRLAGEQAITRSAEQEAIDLLSQALGLLGREPESRERDEQEILLLLELASAMVPRKGWLDPEVEDCYRRALGRAEALGDEGFISAALFANATMHEVRGEYERAGKLMESRMGLHGPPTPQAPLESCELLACSEFHRGLFGYALGHAEQGISLFKQDLHSGFATFGESPGVGCHDWAALSRWFLGYPKEAEELVDRALELTQLPGNAYSRTLALTQAAVLSQVQGNVEATRRYAESAVEAALEFGYGPRAAWGAILLGWARTRQGDTKAGIEQIQEGIERSLAIGARMDHPYYQVLLADAFREIGDLLTALDVIDEALGAIRKERKFFYEAEMLRLKGRLLTELGGKKNRTSAHQCWREAMDVARGQDAKPLLLRAALDTICLGDGHDEDEALDTLKALLDWFGDDQTMPEVEDARAILGI